MNAPRPEPLPPAEVQLVELVRVRLPMVVPFRTSFGVQRARDALLVRVVTDAGEGWGECVTPAAPVYSEEYTAGAADVLSSHLVPALLAVGVTVAAEDVRRRLGGFKGHRMAKAALETAILDAQLRAAGRSLARHLGAIVDRVPAGVSVGIPDGGTSELLDLVAAYREAGYLRIKAKVARGHDVTPVTALRARFGDDLDLQVDANAGYDPDDPDDVTALDGLDELGLVQLEQPFAPNRLRDHARHAARWRTPVCLDESIVDAIRARDAVAAGACSIVNIKPGRVGGLLEAVAVHDTCRELDVPVWCGGMLETGIGRAANVALAALPNFRMPGDTSASDRYFVEDVTEPFVLEDGHVAVPAGPGIGRAPRPDVLRTATRVRLV
jgi:o-succinylbenzoate synthase